MHFLVISECQDRIEVHGGGNVKQVHPEIFEQRWNVYRKDSNQVNGRAAFTSYDEMIAITFNQDDGYWYIQHAPHR